MKIENNNIFKITLLISLIVHAFILIPMPNLKKKPKPAIDPVFFNYLALSIPQPKAEQIKIANKGNFQKEKRSKSTKKTYRTIRSNKKIKKNLAKIERKKEIAEKVDIPKPVVKKEILTKKNAVLPKKEENLSKDKYYISYYRLINELLRDSVIYPDDFSEGEIALTFVLNSDGSLVNVDVLQDTSYNNNTLRETAKQIIKTASPFPPFPKELRQEQLTFNVVFCFRERS